MPVSSNYIEPRLTVLVGVGPKMTQVLTPDFRAEAQKATSIRGKLTVSF